jgi:hypothetical protein
MGEKCLASDAHLPVTRILLRKRWHHHQQSATT